jgi:hypothetical protein
MPWGMLDLVQWPAMLLTLLASWRVASRHAPHRAQGFWLFLASNLLWVVWGWHTRSWALVMLQVGLVLMNLRGMQRNTPATSEHV